MQIKIGSTTLLIALCLSCTLRVEMLLVTFIYLAGKRATYKNLWFSVLPSSLASLLVDKFSSFKPD